MAPLQVRIMLHCNHFGHQSNSRRPGLTTQPGSAGVRTRPACCPVTKSALLARISARRYGRNRKSVGASRRCRWAIWDSSR
jgi:hypothetical protein